MNKTFDVIVVGGGTSGLMAAVQASEQGANVLLLEKNPTLGRKLLLSGGGRCNVTNRSSRDNLIKHIPGNGKFLYGPLSQFTQEDIVDFFESNGVKLKEEDHGRMFPSDDKARSILNTFINRMKENRVTIKTKAPVSNLITNSSSISGVKLTNGEKFYAPCIIVSVGGKAYPRTGSTGDGYKWMKQMGHTISPLYPTEAPLLSHDSFILNQSLRGVSLRDVEVSVWGEKIDKKPITSHQMDMIFTHFGYSGPAILRSSGHVNQFLMQTKADKCLLTINLWPHKSLEDLQAIKIEFENQRNKQLLTLLKKWMPEKLAKVISAKCGLDSYKPYKQLTHSQIDQLFKMIQAFPISVYKSEPIEKGFVTGGGVITDEIDPKTMESKIINGLYLSGELLDINGYTGGYNITAALVTGAVAGRQAAWASFSKTNS